MRTSRLESFQRLGSLSLVLLLAVPAAAGVFAVQAGAGEVTAASLAAFVRDRVEGLTLDQLAPFAWAAVTGAAAGFVVALQLVRAERRRLSRLRFQELSGLLGTTAEVGNDDLIPLARRILAAGGGSADQFFEAGGALHDQFRKLRLELSMERLPTLRWRDGEIFDESGEACRQRIKPLLDEMRHQWPPNLGRINSSLDRVVRSDAAHRAS